MELKHRTSPLSHSGQKDPQARIGPTTPSSSGGLGFTAGWLGNVTEHNEKEDPVGEKLDKAEGKLKEGAGKLTGDQSLEEEGKRDQAKGDLKEGVEKVKDAIDDVRR